MRLEIGWIIGFVDAEGCFYVALNKNRGMTHNIQCLPEFTVTQHLRDIAILHALRGQFKCGVVRLNNGNVWSYRVRGHADLLERIIPFFEKHKLKTKKRTDFLKFRRVVRLMSEGVHLTEKGIAKIRAISETMNTKEATFLPTGREGTSNPLPKIESSPRGNSGERTEQNSLTPN